MLWFIQVSVVSLIIIFVMHNLYSFFKETLTVPKIKDMVKRPQQRYDALFRELRDHVALSEDANAGTDANADTANASNGASSINASSTSADDMKNELKRYLMNLNSSQQTHADPQPQSDFIEMGSIYK
jgi:hypothetical protein